MKIRIPLFLGIVAGLLALVLVYHAQAETLSEQPAEEASLVQVNTQCDNQTRHAAFPRFARLMHDPQWMEYPSRMAAPDWPSGFHYDWYPQTVQLLVNPKSGDGRFAYTRAWLQYLRDLQPDDATAVWIARIAAGLFNRNGNVPIPILNLEQLKQEPVAESISSGGNVVRILETRNGSGRIEMIYFKDTPPEAEYMNYQNFPWLVTKFTSVSMDGDLGNAGGIDVYFPNLSKQKEGYWVDLKRVEFFPQLPYCATAKRDLQVLNDTNGLAKQLATLAAGQSFSIREYLPQGSDVWGRIDEGWVLLQYLNAAGQPVYTTDWQMDTRPPILFPNR
ncbi:MAG: hypothetical protein KIT46_07810 [Anaerolineales bacterium]|nr:hypothetical protein [Anaerolineales bacterium]MCW5855935.1 hypothetical protein [Anaerolineales bacterium]